VSHEPKIWTYDESAYRETATPGMLRRVFNGDQMSLAFWRIKSGVGPTPYGGHPENEQFGLIIAGQLDFRIGSDERVTLGPGDVYWAPTNMPHGDSKFVGDPARNDEVWILDIFHPVREEYRNG
jgi:mannose-6-phosphate isomerase-like protein (cupin superfamily)